jgi:ribonuclease VapC
LIVVDSSAILAIYLAEPDAEQYALAIESDAEPIISAASVLECSIVMRGRKARSDSETESWLDGFLQAAGIAVHDVSARQIDIARMAHRLYGKGSGHGASLNFGDCFSYALAVSLATPLLYKGDDFAKTDIRSAL